MAERVATFDFQIPVERSNMDGPQGPKRGLAFFLPRNFTNELSISTVTTQSAVHGLDTPSLTSAFQETQPLKRQADQIISTDRSVQDTGEPEHSRCRAGVH